MLDGAIEQFAVQGRRRSGDDARDNAPTAGVRPRRASRDCKSSRARASRALYRADRPLELPGRLFVRLALEIAEDDGMAIFRGQAGQLLIEDLADLAIGADRSSIARRRVRA